MDPNAPGKHGWTPLIGYLFENDISDTEIELLVNSGLDLNTRRLPFRSTYLMIAVEYGRPLATQALLDRGIVYVTADSDGWNVLHFAASRASLPILKVLRNHGLRGLNAIQQDVGGATPARAFEHWSRKSVGYSDEIREAFYDLLDAVMFRDRVAEVDAGEAVAAGGDGENDDGSAGDSHDSDYSNEFSEDDFHDAREGQQEEADPHHTLVSTQCTHTSIQDSLPAHKECTLTSADIL